MSEVSLENIILAIPSYNLRLTVMEMLVHAKEKFKTVEDFSSLCERNKENGDVILVIDILAYSVSERSTLTKICREISLPIILLLYRNELATEDYLEFGQICCVVEKEAMDSTFLLALNKARQMYEKKSALENLLNLKEQLPPFNQREVNLMEKEEGNIFGKRFGQKFGRRSFLKGSAAAAAVAGVAVASPESTIKKALAVKDEEGTAMALMQEEIFAGHCRGNCFGGCFLNIHVRDGKVVRTSARDFPDNRYKRVCLKGLTHHERIYDPNRLKYPMKRVGERGSGEWERISWDEAITTIADGWKTNMEKYGKSSNSFCFGSGSWGCLSGVGLGEPFSRIRSLIGGASIDQSFDLAFVYQSSRMLGMDFNAAFNEPADMMNANTIIVWGGNPVESQIHNWHFIAKAIEKGAKLIVIDPIFTETASKAHYYIPVKSGTDGALAMAMCNVVIEENLTDIAFLKKSSVAPFLVKESDGKYLRLSDIGRMPEGGIDEIVVRGADGTVGLPSEIEDPVINGTFTINNVKVTTAYDLLLKSLAGFTPEKAEGICNIPADTIREIARVYGKNTPGTIYHGFAMDHFVTGHYSYFASIALAILTGNVGKAGASAGWCYSYGANVVSGAMSFPSGFEPGPSVSNTILPEVMESKMYDGKPLDLKSVFIYCINPVGNVAQRKKTIEFLQQLDMVVVAEMTLSETAKYADIVLPVAHWFEVNDICGNNTQHPFITFQEKAVEPPFECKNHLEIAKLLADKLGFSEYFNMSEDEYMANLLDWEGARAQGITFEKLKSEKVLRGWPEIAIHGYGGVFPTPTKRAEFYMENVVPRVPHGQEFDIERERLPIFEPPNEAWHENPLYQKYPLFYTQEHSRWRTHSQWSHVPILRELDPEPIVYLNPDDAKARSIKTGDIVRVFNDRGHVVIKAVINAGVSAGLVNIPKGWQEDQYIEGHYQDLTNHLSHPVTENNSYFDVLVQVEKI